MKYITQINLFNQWLETNYLTANAQLLWYKLMNLFNKTGWADWVQVDNLRLMTFIQAESKGTAIRARDELKEKGFLEYKKGCKGSPNAYKITDLENLWYKNWTEYGTVNGLNVEPKTDWKQDYKRTENETEYGTHNKTKTKTKTKTTHHTLNKEFDTKGGQVECAKKQLDKDFLGRFISSWNTMPIVKIKSLNAERIKGLAKKIDEYGEDSIFKILEIISKSDFLQGGGKKGWKISIDWLLDLREDNYLKVLENTYENRVSSGTKNTDRNLRVSDIYKNEAQRDEIEERLLNKNQLEKYLGETQKMEKEG